MGKSPGKRGDVAFEMPASKAFLKSVDKWRTKQDDKPSRVEAVERLVEIGLACAEPLAHNNKKAAVKASRIAAHEIDLVLDRSVSREERERRKLRLLKGPPEFREMRVGQSKTKGRGT